ncbi:hypothetical protein GA0070622_2947 [Micromonospora sediminicola]|uniref:Uncharacterized protein n=1 Tax=Micromonospora sediminicola TaxID=946078 RepID=A0A1A9BA42_9ACTN|nr:hypothetical protein GA0070622_2947 [Micromonospora sediminicola]
MDLCPKVGSVRTATPGARPCRRRGGVARAAPPHRGCCYRAVQVRVGAELVPFQEALKPKLVVALALREPL